MTLTEELIEREPGLARITGKIEEIGSLPTIPAVAQLAINRARDERSSMRGIADVISQDQAIAARILKVVNSAYYGLTQSVGSLPLALTVLGVREIVNLVMSVSVVSAFPSSSDNELFSQDELWHASATCACIAKSLAHGVGLGRFGSEAFLGGLVRDIGLIVLHQYLHDEFMAMLGAAKEQGLGPLEAEHAHLGATHPGIGAWLASKWAFPALLVDGIAYHHTPAEGPWDPPLAAVVYLAGLVLDCQGADMDVAETAEAIEADAVWERLMACGQPVRPPASVTKLLDKIAEELEAAPLILT